MRKLIIEARVNEYMMREAGNPNVPYSPEEIARDAVACREAGAAVLHFHARHPDGTPDHAAATYAETVRRIRVLLRRLPLLSLWAYAYPSRNLT